VSEAASQGQNPAQAVNVDQGKELLDLIVDATPMTERAHTTSLVGTFLSQVASKTKGRLKSVSAEIERAIREIDEQVSKQVSAIMHVHEFQKLEGSWRGLHHLVMNSETGTSLKLKVMNAKKTEIAKDLEKAAEFDQSETFKKMYENEFGMPGGEPYGALIGDYEFSNHPEDVDMLTKMSNVAAAAFCPFITAPSPALLGMKSWTELSKPRDLAKIHAGPDFTQYNAFRNTEDARFVCLTMPRVLARLPYGASTKKIEEFGFEEVDVDAMGHAKPVAHDNYCWMNSAYVMGTTLTSAFAQHGWCVAIRGAEGGGRVDGLPTHVFRSDDGDLDTKCPTEIGIGDRREKELSDLGFLSLGHYKNKDFAVFFGAQTAQKPKKYDKPDATANAAISARLPYIMATSRIAHYLKVMARDKIGSFMEASDCESWLHNWLQNYVNANSEAGQETKAKFPLRDAKVEVKEIPGMPGSYNAVAYLRPWLQMEELNSSMRLVAKIPQKAG
jgi:type VI secretion system protein ImpC